MQRVDVHAATEQFHFLSNGSGMNLQSVLAAQVAVAFAAHVLFGGGGGQEAAEEVLLPYDPARLAQNQLVHLRQGRVQRGTQFHARIRVHLDAYGAASAAHQRVPHRGGAVLNAALLHHT